MTKHNLLAQSLQIKALYKIMLIKHKFNPNYYPSVARVDSNLIESTYIFPETLKQKCITACVEKKIQVKKNKNLDFKHKQ